MDEITHIVPVALGEVDSRRPPLDAGTVDQDVDFVVHDLKGSGKYAFDLLHVVEVCIKDFNLLIRFYHFFGQNNDNRVDSWAHYRPGKL